MARRLSNYVRQPKLGQIVYTNGAHALRSGKVIKVHDPIHHRRDYGKGYVQEWTEYHVTVRWISGRESVEKGPLRDSEADVEDRLRSYEQAKEAVERAKLL